MLGKADRLLSAKTGLLHRSASEQSDCAHGTGGAGHYQSSASDRYRVPVFAANARMCSTTTSGRSSGRK